MTSLQTRSLGQLRRYAIARSLFEPTTLPRAIARLGFVQADPMRAPARAQDLILVHRVKDYRAGDLVELTVVEYDLLEKLLRSAGQIAKREELVKEVLGRELSPFDRSIDMHVSNLRKKLGHQLNGLERIKTIRGVGYIYAASAAN